MHEVATRRLPQKIRVAGALSNTDYCAIHDFQSDVNATDDKEFECVSTTTSPNIKICLYPDDVDIYVSASIRARGRWEHPIGIAINDVMRLYADATFIDIGSNLGIHSLVVARNGHRVVAVEPKWSSIQRFHKSVNLNKLTSNIVLAKNAVSNKRELVNLYSDDTNQGGSSIQYRQQHTEQVQAVLMDDLLELLTTKVAILKVDIQGAEYNALMNSSKLFSRVRIPAIFMEFEEMARQLRTEKKTRGVFVLEMVARLRHLGYKPYSLDNPQKREYVSDELLDTNMKTWPINIVWVKPELSVLLTEDSAIHIRKHRL